MTMLTGTRPSPEELARSLSNRRFKRPFETVIVSALTLCGVLSFIITALIVFTLLGETVNFFEQVSFAEFFLSTEWQALIPPNYKFGVWELPRWVFGKYVCRKAGCSHRALADEANTYFVESRRCNNALNRRAGRAGKSEAITSLYAKLRHRGYTGGAFRLLSRFTGFSRESPV